MNERAETHFALAGNKTTETQQIALWRIEDYQQAVNNLEELARKTKKRK